MLSSNQTILQMQCKSLIKEFNCLRKIMKYIRSIEECSKMLLQLSIQINVLLCQRWATKIMRLLKIQIMCCIILIARTWRLCFEEELRIRTSRCLRKVWRIYRLWLILIQIIKMLKMRKPLLLNYSRLAYKVKSSKNNLNRQNLKYLKSKRRNQFQSQKCKKYQLKQNQLRTNQQKVFQLNKKQK